MKRTLQFMLIISTMLVVSSVSAQEWMDYVEEIKGDTVVIKPMTTGTELNSVFFAIMLDEDRGEPNRVYETVRGGVYLYDGPATLDASVPDVRIVAQDGTDRPPLHIKTPTPTGNIERALFALTGNLYAENQYFSLAATNDARDRGMFDNKGEDQLIELKNCVVEVTDWTIFMNWVSGLSVKLTDCFFHNLGREGTIEKGCVLDGAGSMRSFYMENNTFLNFGMVSWNREGAGIADIYINHNTFVNATRAPIQSYTEAYQVMTNNLFVNIGLVPDYSGFYTAMEDEDGLPIGLVNIDTVEASMLNDFWPFEYPIQNEADRKMLIDKNSVFWDAKFTDMFDNQLPDASPNTWNDQKITMNGRTQSMFDDDANYPFLTEGSWYNEEPDFVNNMDLVDEWVQFIVTNSTPGAPNGGNPVPNWRTNLETNLVEVDWPILADLSYSNATLVSGGIDGYPLGDLNWFPNLKADWEELDQASKLIAARDAGELISSNKTLFKPAVDNIKIYPNPVDLLTSVEFNLPNNSPVDIIVYDMAGKKLMVESIDGIAGFNSHSINVSDLQEGIYMLQLNTKTNYGGSTKKFVIQR